MKTELFSFYCALCPRAETDSTTTFSFTVFLICRTRTDIFLRTGGVSTVQKQYKKKERETFGFEQRELENRTTRAQEILSFQNVVSIWITTKPQKFPNSPLNGNSESLSLEMLKQGVSDTSSCPRHAKRKWHSHQLVAAPRPASLRMCKAFWGHLQWHYSGASPRVTKLWALFWQHSSQMDFLGTAQLVCNWSMQPSDWRSGVRKVREDVGCWQDRRLNFRSCKWVKPFMQKCS